MKNFLIAILLFSNLALAQKPNKTIDTLIEKFENTLDSQPDSAIIYISKAKRVCEKTSNNYLLARCYYKLGYFYYTINDVEKSKIYLNRALIVSRKAKNFKSLAASYNQLGVIDMEKSDFNTSLKKLLISKKIAEEKNLPVNQCSALINLANLYELQKDTIKAMNYYIESIDISKKNSLKDYTMYGYNNLALLFRNSEKQKSISYHNKVYTIAKDLKDINQQFITLINLSEIYISIETKLSYYRANVCLQKAEIIARELKNPQNLFYVYFNYGGYYNKTKNYEKAQEYYLKAQSLSNSGVDNEQILNLKKAFEKNYNSKGDFKNAYLYKVAYQKLKDSIFTIEKTKTFNNIQTKYEVEKKNLKISLLSKEKIIEENKKRTILYTGIAIISLLLFVLLFFRNRIKLQKIIHQKENELFLQEKTKLQQEQEIKRVIGLVEGQDQERNRVAKEIHDGIGGELAGIKLHLSQINTKVQNENITTIVDQLGGLFYELRNISHNLSSNFIKDRDFTSVLLELKNEYDLRKEFEIEITIFPDDAFVQTPENTKHQLYRIVQELLSNISKHANASKVAIAITNHDHFLNILIEDNGKGFDENSKNGIGLKNIEERIKTLNGKLVLETIPNKGSTFIIDLPN